MDKFEYEILNSDYWHGAVSYWSHQLEMCDGDDKKGRLSWVRMNLIKAVDNYAETLKQEYVKEHKPDEMQESH